MLYKRLFAEGKIGALTVKNRLVMPAMGVGLANPDGTVSDAMIAYYEERAKGGAGLIITEVTMVNGEHGRHNPHQLAAFGDNHIEGLGRLAAAVHRHGAKIFVQLYHPGNQTFCALIGQPVLTPSGVISRVLEQEARVMTADEIKSLVGQFADAAARAKTAGIDGVELHAAHGYLLNEFLSPYTNRRTDEYGGSLENRARIVRDSIVAIRQRLGRKYPVILRISVDEFLHMTDIGNNGLVLADGLKTAAYLEAFGIDAVSVSSGIYDTQNVAWEPTSYKQGWKLYLAEAVKQVVRVPVIAVSVIREPAFAEKILEEGSADFVGIARGQLADPEWGRKALEGRDEEIRKCISCLHCMEMLSSRGKAECGLNARSNHEFEYGELKQSGAGRAVAVIGAGPAGMEAARVLAVRGFKPILFEKAAAIGGQLNYACKPPLKEKLSWPVDYYKKQFELLGVEIRLNAAPTVDELKALKPYAVFVATGSVPLIPASIKGIDRKNAFSTVDILSGKHAVSNKAVAVVGSGMTGLETAEFLAAGGNRVTVVEMLESVGPDAYRQNLLDVMARLKQHQVEFMPGQKLIEIKKDRILLESSNGAVSELAVDCVVLSLGVRAVRDMWEEILKSFTILKFVGDADKIGRIANAVRTGYEAAASLQ
jgi:2,4-dienoyl-CoA reductase-like NADH-dependent reductase (Old Yellow Enzyme family)/thioredoxin reductase